MTGSAIHPREDLGPGRYLLDREGRLHQTNADVRAVAAVNVLDHLKSQRRAAELREAEAAERIRIACAAEATARETRLREAKRLTTAHPLPVTPRPEQPTRPMARRVRPTAVQVPKEEIATPDEDADAVAEFQAKLKAVQTRRAKKAPMVSEPRIDGARVAAAHRAKSLGPPPKKIVQRQALADAECYRCGTRTTIGCDHFLPFRGKTNA